MPPDYKSLYQINTRVWLRELGRQLSRPATLDDVPDAELHRWAALGFDWIWLLSVWQTGPAGQSVSRGHAGWRTEFAETLDDLTDDDIGGSGFAITSYTVHSALCGDAGLARLRERMRKRGLRLVLDFVPNHTGLDHPWVAEHPEYYVSGSEADLARAPQNYTWVKGTRGDRLLSEKSCQEPNHHAVNDGGSRPADLVPGTFSCADLLLAYGRDPFFTGWPDVLQLNYGDPAVQEAMIGQLLKIAGQCDAVRCDMAMLVLPEVFERTWGIHAEPFWPRAIGRVKEHFPNFRFMAEVYWDLEWTLQQQGFDFTYDKRLYDRLRAGQAKPVREHFLAGLDFQDKLMRFLENHDEPRAAVAFSTEMHGAAAVITFLAPGLRFFHQGEFEGRRKRISPHLSRAPIEPVDADLRDFYDRLLAVVGSPIVRNGRWQLLECTPAWDGNWTYDCFISFAWQTDTDERLIVAVNYAPNQSQCYVRLPFTDLPGRSWRLTDQLSPAIYDRSGDDLQARGLYLDLAPWQFHVFSLTWNEQ